MDPGVDADVDMTVADFQAGVNPDQHGANYSFNTRTGRIKTLSAIEAPSQLNPQKLTQTLTPVYMWDNPSNANPDFVVNLFANIYPDFR
ncbi:hypothetical protein H5T88_03770 [bacterium]|nr:hypothetical protein [bacterium]